jgi:hypothetical protein
MNKQEIIDLTKAAITSKQEKQKEQWEKDLLERLPWEERHLIENQIKEAAGRGEWQTYKSFSSYQLTSDLRYWLVSLGFAVEPTSYVKDVGSNTHALYIRWNNENEKI